MEADLSDSPLAALIREIINNSDYSGETEEGTVLSAISFHQYMTHCLYHPEFGYYRTGASRVGREGDFYTSSHIGEWMGEHLASELSRLAGECFTDGEPVEVLDWGGGTGRLSRQMLDLWQRDENHSTAGTGMSANRFHLTIIEGNPEHRLLASKELAHYIDAGKARVVDREEGESLPLHDRPVIVVANELLDAFPVYRLTQRGGRLLEWGVAIEEKERRLIPCLMEPSNPRLMEWVVEEGITLLDLQTFELNLDAADWVAKMAERIKRGMLVFVDYGDEMEELISPHRMDGTFLCYYRHQAHIDPFRLPGEQDMTSHVNFSHIRRVAEHNGLRELWYGTQKKFLVEAGLLDKLSAHAITDPFHPTVRRNRSIRQLLLSDGMSELFKVQIFIKL